LGGPDPPGCHEAAKRGVVVIGGAEDGYQLAALSDLETLTLGDPAEVLREVLAELANANAGKAHVYTECSTTVEVGTDLVTLGVVRHRSGLFAVSEK
jgi:hypothetical protein